MRLLVVDDDPVFRQELAELLEQDGHRVQALPSVLKAEEALTAEEFDVVLTDLKMPRHGGMELLRSIRSRWPRVLVVVVTGYASVDTALEAMKLGAFDYVRKPFRIEQVRETLRLAAQEREFGAPAGAERDPAREARELAEGGRYEVLLVGSARTRPADHLTVAVLDDLEPASLLSLVEGFVTQHPNAAVVIAHLDPWLARHRLEDLVATLDRVRSVLAGHGPLRVAFNPARVDLGAATALGSAVAAEETHATLEALANPLRRRILARLAEGPASFGEAMRATGLDDSPKISFHLRKLAESGLLLHEGEQYRLTARGRASVRLLAEAAFLPSGGEAGNLAFAERGSAEGSEGRPATPGPSGSADPR